MDKYLERLSGPLLNRIDIHVEAPAVPFKELSRDAGYTPAPVSNSTSTATMREQVLAAQKIQTSRQGPMLPNARLSAKQLDQMAKLDDRTMALLGDAMTQLRLSARAYDKIRRVARTVADLEASEKICEQHVLEAIGYRLLDRKA